MIFTVVLPNSVVIEIDVDIRANGQECLDQVCLHLGILEYDYFGLQFSGNKGEKIWLNMRNRINQQVSEMRAHRFHLRVKFYIQPHLLLQESSRHLFYIQVKQEILFKTLHVQDETKLVTILALIAQEEFGDHVSNRLHLPGYETFLERICPQSDPDFLKSVASCHSELRGVSSQNAEYRMLQEASTLEDYGMEKHEVKMDRKLMSVGVGPEGVFIYDNHMELVDRIEYPMIQRIVHDACSCFMSVYTEEMETRRIEVRLRTLRAASCLYRCITEMHSFFRCDTVNSEVSSQTYRDLKGLLASLFNENTTTGQNYVFDVQRTWREAYDSTRRKLMKEAANQSLPPPDKEEMEDSSETHILPKNHECQDVQVLKAKLEKIHESFLCSVCMDCDISTAFCPCGHMTCCQNCASRLDECPLCRTNIQNVQPIFLPTTLIQKS
ncbi:E3 ubiquitin-protein ligase MYLIP-like [Mytilus trossulus]|uniref:E3 ubiquitin-protein ligase MYLIP-like n=1 Tax=Mytilus trossulus TaxID=6551 RepID=UPI003005666A